jgi:hypothetical protein
MKEAATLGKINSEWHREHRMPANATKQQRAAWHYEHAQHCGCRALTPSITSLLVSEGYEIPRRAGEAAASD